MYKNIVPTIKGNTLNNTKVNNQPLAKATLRPEINVDITYKVNGTLSPIAPWKDWVSEENWEDN